MKPSRLVGLLVIILTVALVSAKVDLDMLVQDTTRIEGDLDMVLESIKSNPLDRLHDGPMAPHASSRAELAQEVRIGTLGGAAKPTSILGALSAGAHNKLAPTPKKGGKVSLLEQGGKVSIDLKNTFEAQLGDPNLNGPEPADQPFYAARTQFHNTKPGDIELRLRKLWPKPVIIKQARVQQADVYMNADEILPKDPQADTMLNHFNEKYGVFDDKGVPSNMPEPPNSDLLPANRENLTAVARDYVGVYDAANKFGFNAEKDSVQSLDKMLADMWNKRWEYFASEKSAADAKVAALTAAANAVPTYPIDALFPRKQINVDDKGEALLGNVYVFDDKPPRDDPLPHVSTREAFTPETTFYGPSVHTKAVNVADSLIVHGQPELIDPEYSEPVVQTKQVIKLIPEVPAVV